MAARVPKVHVVDFETEAIQKRPDYPPKPVGVSIQVAGQRAPRYYSWGHPSGNNCTKAEAEAALRAVWESREGIVFHNGKFDIDVAMKHMRVKELPWERIHDTLFLLFLYDPHAISLSLKPAAEKLLDMPPEERDAVADWLVEHKIIRKGQGAGAYIAKAPGTVVGPYANGDCVRTLALFKMLYPWICEAGMLPAYQRELKLLPILLRNESQGIRADLPAMEADFKTYSSAMLKTDAWLRKRLGVKDLNVDADQDLADALESAGVVTDWDRTAPTKRHPTGVRSVAKKTLTIDKFSDTRVFQALGYRNRLATCLGTFMEPWITIARENNGVIFTNWNQVRQAHGNDGFQGTRTGRLSSSPNFQNIPKSFEDRGDGYKHPAFLRQLELPMMRRYILPDKGQVFCHRDYNQQELRILAHFEDGLLMRLYNENPRLDVHQFVHDAILELIGLDLTRSATKILNFGMIYGMGLGKLAAGMLCDVQRAKQVKNAQLTALPGLKSLTKGISATGKAGEAIRTWGGRLYECEPAKIVDGRHMTFEYKLLNYLIQGSAADCTKEAIIRYDAARKHGRFLVTVHDENNISVPPKAVKSEMRILRECMQSVEFDVPMLSDGKTGPCWGALTKFEE